MCLDVKRLVLLRATEVGVERSTAQQERPDHSITKDLDMIAESLSSLMHLSYHSADIDIA